MLPDERVYNVYGDVMRCGAQPPNLNSTNIFLCWFGAKPPNLKTVNIFGYTVFNFYPGLPQMIYSILK